LAAIKGTIWEMVEWNEQKPFLKTTTISMYSRDVAVVMPGSII